MTDILLLNVRPMGADPVDIRIASDGIVAMGPDLSRSGDGGPRTVIDGRGLLALPGFVNAHAHVDKSWWGQPWVSAGGAPGTQGRIVHERAERDRLGLPSVASTRRVLAEFLRHGTTDVLTHVDVDPGVGLRGIEVVREAVATFGGALRVEMVAFAQDGVLRRPGVDALLAQAARDGVRAIGGLDPGAIDRDPAGQLDLLFRIATEHDVDLDIHLHETGELGTFQIELIIERTIRHARQGRVTISHAFALGQLPPDQQARVVEHLAGAGIALATVTPVNPPPLPLRSLVKHGVRFGLGTDGIRDLWSPFGDGDMLRLANTLARKNALVRDADLAMALDVALGRTGSLMAPGFHPDLAVGATGSVILVDAENLAQTVAAVPARQTVIAHGQAVVVDGVVQPLLQVG